MVWCYERSTLATDGTWIPLLPRTLSTDPQWATYCARSGLWAIRIALTDHGIIVESNERVHFNSPLYFPLPGSRCFRMYAYRNRDTFDSGVYDAHSGRLIAGHVKDPNATIEWERVANSDMPNKPFYEVRMLSNGSRKCGLRIELVS